MSRFQNIPRIFPASPEDLLLLMSDLCRRITGDAGDAYAQIDRRVVSIRFHADIFRGSGDAGARRPEPVEQEQSGIGVCCSTHP